MNRRATLLLTAAALAWAGAASAQGVTTSAMSGIVNDAQGLATPGATVTATHEPSGTRYTAVTQTDGHFAITGMRVGGPYTVVAALSGFQPHLKKDLHLNLGVTMDVVMSLGAVATAEEITVTASSDAIFSSARSGTATTVTRATLEAMPTLDGRLGSYVRLTPQSSGGMSFAGQDNRLNNITVDGSSFNNSFGLGGTPGDRTGVAPISVHAIEEVQVNIAPYDVRYGNFVGAGVNTVTRSGTNAYRGAAYYQFRDQDFVGTKAGGSTFIPGTFSYQNYGGWSGGPVERNRIFYFFNLEGDAQTEPGTNFRANAGGEPTGGQVTRVLASDLDALSSFLSSKFNYTTGVYQGYDHEVPAKRLLAKGDFNLSSTSKLSLRYTHLDSSTDVLLSNSNSLGFGSRRSSTQSLNFRNSNYKILENIRSFIGEWNKVIGGRASNTLIAGYTHQDESRDSLGTFFPMVDVLEGSSIYTTFGFEPFTPNNELRYGTFQLQNNLTFYRGQHSLTFGVNAERYESENIFFPGSQSIYVYNSLADFYADSNDYLANPNRTTSPVTLRRFQVRWMNIPGLDKPVQPLEVWSSSAYIQDQWRPRHNLTLMLGVRMDVNRFGNTAFANANADALVFRDGGGNPVQYASGKLPDAKPLWSPRIGFNWDLSQGAKNTQLRGGSGLFTGRPAYVWISNQIGNTGVLTGFEQVDNTRNRPWHPDPRHYWPAEVTGQPASSYELALTEPDFQFPQVFRSNFAIDQKLGWGWAGTLEVLHTKDVKGLSYINANLPAADTAFVGADNRPRWTGTGRIHNHVSSAIVLQNQNEGSGLNVALSAERLFKDGLWIKTAWSFNEAQNEIDHGSIAIGSWTGNAHRGDPNNPGTGYTSLGHRMFVAGSFTRQWFDFGGTTITLYFDGSTGGGASYRFASDMNGDGSSNDLIYIHRDTSEMNFQTFTTAGRTFTADEQAAAWDAYIRQDPYLSRHRGQYAQRGAAPGPWSFGLDMSLAQDIFVNASGRRHGFQLRFDILNFNNLLNSSWGIGQSLVSSTPLTNPAVDAQGRSTYRLRVINGELMSNSYQRSPGSGDVWRMQLSLRYTFN